MIKIRSAVCLLGITSLAFTGCGSSDASLTSTSELNVTSTSYTKGGVIPLTYAAVLQGGSNTSPQLTWSPSADLNVSSYAVIMDDETTPCGTGTSACVHWGVYNIPSTTTSFTENFDTSSFYVGTTYNGTKGYNGPNPPSGLTHTYNITVYALSSGMPTIGDTQDQSATGGFGITSAQFETDYAAYILKQTTYAGNFTGQ